LNQAEGSQIAKER
jgi:hypothetical protein